MIDRPFSRVRPAPSRPPSARIGRLVPWHPSPLAAAARVAPAWSLAYGLVALAWAGGCAGYPFSPAVDPDARLALLGGLPPVGGAGFLAVTSLLGALVGVAMGRGLGRAVPRRLAIAFGTAMAILFTLLLPDVRVLVVLGYTPILLAGAPFGWPPGASLASELTWPLVHQVLVIAGGLAWAGATVRYRRLTAGACGRCGRAPGEDGKELAWAAGWGRRAVVVAIVIPLLYAATRWAWFLGIPLGMPAETLAASRGAITWTGGALLAAVAAGGALLTTGLVCRWGEAIPARVPFVGGRRIPPGVAIVPAALMTVVITAAGLMFVRTVIAGTTPLLVVEWAVIAPTLLWPAWGMSLGVATFAYARRRRGACDACGLGRPTPTS